MKRTVLFGILSLILFSGCQKIIEKKAEDAIIKAMTSGQWVVTSFITDGNNITADFSPYAFRYNKDYTVDAIKNGSVEKTGTWAGDAANMNISAQFPTPPNPLDLINGTWHITNNSWTFVEATMTVNNEVRTLRLDKQ